MSFLTGLKPYLWVACIVAIIASYGLGHHKGYTLAALEQQAVIGQLNEKAREDERAHTEAINQMATQLTKANHDADIQTSRLRSQLRAGTRSLFLPAACPVQAGASAATPTGDRNEARAELDGATADALVSIAEDGDKAIRQLNSCIDAYNALRP